MFLRAVLSKIREKSPRMGAVIESLNLIIRYGVSHSTPNYIVNSDKQVVYLKICKAACSSILVSMFGGEFNDDYSIHNYVRGHKLIRNGKLEKKENTFYKFSFVRNPFSRLVSCYVDRFERQRFFDKRGFGLLYGIHDFETFISKLYLIPRFLLDEHCTNQYELLFDRKGRIRVDYLGHFETLEKDFAPLCERYGLAPLKHYNSSTEGKDRNWMDFYTLETAEKVYKKYYRDFEAFGYKNSYKELLEYIKNKRHE